MAKRLSERQKEEICKLFTSGISIDELSNHFNCTKLTISRNLKKNLGENQFKELIRERKLSNKDIQEDQGKLFKKAKYRDKNLKNKKSSKKDNIDKNFDLDGVDSAAFVEITPLNLEIDKLPQKDLSSIPISEIKFPKTVYMIVQKNIELETKYLKDFPDWQFLAQDDLNRKIIQIYIDLKKAKRNCSKEQKILKVPNTEVFKIVAPILKSKGISRIVSDNNLIAL